VDLEHWLSNAVAAIEEWQDGFGPYHADPSVLVSDERFADAFGELTGRLQNNYPKRRSSPRWPPCSAWTPTSAT